MLFFLIACKSSEVEDLGPGETRAVVINNLAFGRRKDDGTAWGFDLDNRVSTASDSEGCNKADLQTPDGLVGVDSAFSGMVPALEATEAGAVEGLIDDSINNGQLLLLLELAGVQDRVQDSCVDVRILRGGGTPMLGTDGELLDGQTFGVDPNLPGVEMVCMPLVDGSVVARPFDMLLPLQVLDVELELSMHNAALRLDMYEDGTAWGYLAGDVPTSDILQIVEGEGDLGDIRDLVVSLVNAAADLDPSTDGCTGLSIVLEFQAMQAFIME